MGRKHRTFQEKDSSKEKEEALKKKDQKIKELEKEIRNLKSELKTLNKAFEKTAHYIKGNVDGVSIEKMIVAAKSEKTMVEIKKENVCPDCKAEAKTSRLPFGRMTICTAGCGWRLVEND